MALLKVFRVIGGPVAGRCGICRNAGEHKDKTDKKYGQRAQATVHGRVTSFQLAIIYQHIYYTITYPDLYSDALNSNIYICGLENILKNVYNYDDKTMKFVATFVELGEI